MKMKRFLLIGAILLNCLMVSSAVAFPIPTTPFQMFTPYGSPIAGTDALIAELDWLSGSGLAVNANALGPGGAGSPIEFLFQLKLGSIVDVNDGNVEDPTLNGVVGNDPNPYEFTAVGRLWETASGLGSNVANFELAADPTGGLKPAVLEIYVDTYGEPGGIATPGSQASVPAGTGFNDGLLVMTAEPVYLDSIFLITADSNGNGVPDNQDAGIGSSIIGYQVTSFDSNYFDFPWNPLDNPLFVVMQFDGTLNTPPNDVETLSMWDGTVPDYFTGSAPTTPFNTNDLLFEVDGNSHFAPTPEPSTLILLGAGLIGFARVARKKMKK